MLINTVLIFLQNILPIFVVISLLLAQQYSNDKIINNDALLSVVSLLKTTAMGCVCVYLFNYYMPIISQLFSGAGLDIIFSIFFSLIYCVIACLFFISSSINQPSRHLIDNKWCDTRFTPRQISQKYKQKNTLSQSVLFLIFCVHGSYFSFYITSVNLQIVSFEGGYSGVVMGMIIGTGICLSVTILLYFALSTLNKQSSGKIAHYFLLIFGVGQLMQALQLLEQIDIVSSDIPLWSTHYLIAENSEVGYFLTILLGYEATPSMMELIVYISAVVAPVIMTNLIAHKKMIATSTEETF